MTELTPEQESGEVNCVEKADKPSGDEHRTPELLFEKLDHVFHFNLDAAATEANAKCGSFITKEMNGLTSNWRNVQGCSDFRAFCNPPYSKSKETSILMWIKKAFAEAVQHKSIVALLIPADTSTEYFQLAWNYATQLDLLTPRVKFEGTDAGAKFPSMVVIFDGRNIPAPGGTIRQIWQWQHIPYLYRF